MEKIKGLLFDIGGVLYSGDTPIGEAVATIALLQKDFPMRFLTNSTRATPKTIYAKLQKMGFAIKQESLFTALDASKKYVMQKGGSVFTVLSDEASTYFEELRSKTPDFVLVGDAHLNFCYETLNEAFRHLQNGAKLLAAAKNRYFQDSDGKLSLDAGGFIAALEFATAQEAKLIGKPNKEFFHLACASMGLDPSEVLMIGDDIESDIKGAQDALLRAALVKTGKFQPADLEKGIRPDFILPSVDALPTLLL